MKREMIVIPYNYDWNKRYRKIHSLLSRIFKNIEVDIQHFGSTAVEGMPAKPIIDVMVIVKNISKVDEYNTKMICAGYVPKGENGVTGRRYFQKFACDGINHIEHVHCYEQDNPHVIDELMFRDYLRINKDAFEKYKRIKIEASDKYKYSPIEYTEYKSQCITEILERAREYYNEGSNPSSKM
ncbi:MAG: GrpB family protein [Clostridiales bacterium]|nr:GrpB family protein [Clostridiales bacterium]